MAKLEIYLCAFNRRGSYCNGSHRSSNGYVYQYTEIDKTTLYLSIPFLLFNESIVKEIRNFFSNYTNRETSFTDWYDDSVGITESELDISKLIRELNRDYNPIYSKYVFKQGTREVCPFEAGDYSLIPLVENHEDMR